LKGKELEKETELYGRTQYHFYLTKKCDTRDKKKNVKSTRKIFHV